MKPILFNTEMVRAILEGRKTVTRRVVKLPSNIQVQDNGLYTLYAEGTCYENQHIEELEQYLRQPYKVGDVLYVRESWNDDRQFTHDDTAGIYFYKADEPAGKWKWKPSIHMPKAAARIFLRVTSVRVERLQEIDTADDQEFFKEGTADKHSFIELWNSTVKNESQGWYGNPYVWVIEFERVEEPEAAV